MRRRAGLLALALLVLASGLAAWHDITRTERADAAAETAPPPTIPVVAGKSQTKDMPVYLHALGTVQAYYTVTVRTRVDGQIDQVFYKEGQEVKAGDRLLQIDPRPFQATLEQARPPSSGTRRSSRAPRST